MKNKLILIAIISFICIAFNQSRKHKDVVIPKKTNKEVSQSFMMDTYEPITDFEKVYFNEEKGLIQIK